MTKALLKYYTKLQVTVNASEMVETHSSPVFVKMP